MSIYETLREHHCTENVVPRGKQDLNKIIRIVLILIEPVYGFLFAFIIFISVNTGDAKNII